MRFAIEAAFLLIVAAGAALASLSPLQIILLMFVAWILVALIERASSRRPPAERQASGADRRWSWRGRREEPEAARPTSPTAAIEEHPAPTHVRRLEPEPQPSPIDEELAEILAAETLAPLPGPVVTKRKLDLPGLEEPEAAPPPREPEPEPEPEPAPPPAPEPVAVAPPVPPPQPPAAREWNIWDLERLARDRAGDAARDEEWSALFVHLRQFATAEGLLPKEFDGLVRESFAELIQAA